MRTTREAAKEASHKQLTGHLQDLLERNYDAENGYKKAIEHTDNFSLKEFLKGQAALRNHFSTEIENWLRQINEHPRINEHGSGLGNLYRYWQNFTSSFNRRDDEAILNEVIKGEKSMIRNYEEKIRKFKFPVDIKAMLNEHIKKLRKMLSDVKILEDLE